MTKKRNTLFPGNKKFFGRVGLPTRAQPEHEEDPRHFESGAGGGTPVDRFVVAGVPAAPRGGQHF